MTWATCTLFMDRTHRGSRWNHAGFLATQARCLGPKGSKMVVASG